MNEINFNFTFKWIPENFEKIEKFTFLVQQNCSLCYYTLYYNILSR